MRELIRNAQLAGLSFEDIDEIVGGREQLVQNDVYFQHFNQIADRIVAGEKVEDPKWGPLLNLVLIFELASRLAAICQRREIPEDIRLDGYKDIKIWLDYHRQNFQKTGISWPMTGWLINILRGDVLQFGRLQCNREFQFEADFTVRQHQLTGEIIQLPLDAPSPEGPWHILLSPGDPVINLHIPASGPLDIEQCRESMKRMDKFFKGNYKAFVCYSWLLDEQLQQILPADCNIVQFQKLGHLFFHAPESDILRRVFGEKPITQAGEKNMLQLAVGRFLEQGKSFHTGGMYILRDGDYLMRPIRPEDLGQWLHLKERIGWGQTEFELSTIIRLFADKTVSVWDQGKMIGSGAAVCYDRVVANLTMILVDEDYRRRGIGKRIANELLQKLADYPTVKLHATNAGKKLYENIGFEYDYALSRWVKDDSIFVGRKPDLSEVVPVTESDLPEICEFDRQMIGYDRRVLLEALYHTFPQLAWRIRRQGKLCGFCLGRINTNQHNRLTPLEAETVGDACKLLLKCAESVPGKLVLDVPQYQNEFTDFLKANYFKVQRELFSMYLGQNRPLVKENVYFATAGGEFA